MKSSLGGLGEDSVNSRENFFWVLGTIRHQNIFNKVSFLNSHTGESVIPLWLCVGATYFKIVETISRTFPQLQFLRGGTTVAAVKGGWGKDFQIASLIFNFF